MNIPALTGVRGFAAGWVLLYHAWLVVGAHDLSLHVIGIPLVLTPVVSMGWFGVDVFFVLSGFVLTWQVLKDGPTPERPAQSSFGSRYWQFLRRRILRVFPAYYACLSVLLPLEYFHRYGAPPELRDVALHLVMFHNMIDSYLQTINGVFWSLPFEFQFYLVFPLLALMLQGRTALLLLLGIGITAAAKIVILIGGPHGATRLLLNQLPFRLDEFVVGMVAAKISHDRPMAAWKRSALFWIGGLSLLAAAQYYGRAHAMWWAWDAQPLVRGLWVEAAVAAMLIGLSGEGNLGTRLFGNRAMVWIGTISYSIYLWHFPILQVMATRMADFGVPISFRAVLAAGVPAVLLISALSYYVVERPFHASAAGKRQDAPTRGAWQISNTAKLTAWGCALLALAGTVSAMAG